MARTVRRYPFRAWVAIPGRNNVVQYSAAPAVASAILAHAPVHR